MSNWIVEESAYLPLASQQNNARIIYDYFRTEEGWSAEAVCAMIGNMQAESSINPGRWEGDKVGVLTSGFGLVQWTPATKFRNWCYSHYGSDNYTNGDYQMGRIVYEFANGIQWGATTQYPMKQSEFPTSTKTTGYLARTWMLNYEKPAEKYSTEYYQAIRQANAEYWYEYLTGHKPLTISPWMLFVFKRKRGGI